MGRSALIPIAILGLSVEPSQTKTIRGGHWLTGLYIKKQQL